MPRNQPWTPDELILALDVYMRHNPLHISKNHPEIISLSKVLHLMSGAVKATDPVRYRNPNGVYMKLCNFLRFDPDYRGKGLMRGGKLEEAIWKGFSADRALLRRTANAIRARVIGKRQLEVL